MLNNDEEPFYNEMPSGSDIAEAFWHGTDHRNPGTQGIDMYRGEDGYCYVWVEAMVDGDMWEAYLLEVRTKKDDVETRDYLFFMTGANTLWEVEWQNKPIRIDAPVHDHIDRFGDGMNWFTDKLVSHMEEENR